MDKANLFLEAGSTKVITAKMLDESGCPFCSHSKGGSSATRAFLEEELPVELRSCGNVFIFVCGGCHKRAIGVQSLPTANLLETLRSLVAGQYGGVTDDRLIVVSISRTMRTKEAKS